MNHTELQQVIGNLNNPIVIERWEMAKRFVYEMWQHLWKPKDITPTDMFFAFTDAYVSHKMMNKDYSDDVFYWRRK